MSKINRTLFVLLAVCFNIAAEVSTQQGVKDLIQEEFGVSPDIFTNLIFRRYYFIERLKYPMNLVLNSKKSTQFSVGTVERSNHNKKYGGTPLKPLFMVWGDFIQYKNIKDQVLVEDFTKEVFVVSNNLVSNEMGMNLGTHVLEQFIREQRMNSSKNHFMELLPISTEDMALSKDSLGLVDLKPFARADVIVKRFYHLKRVTHAVELLKKLNAEKEIPIHFDYTVNEKRLLLEECVFEEPHIISLIQIIANKRNIRSLISTWKALLRYKYIQNDSIMREFTLLLCLLYNHVLKVYQVDEFIRSEKMHHGGAQLDTMALEEVLDMLDILVDELPGFIQKYELDSELTWKGWMRKYWLVAPVAFSALCLKVYLSVYNGQHPPVQPPPPAI